MNVVVREKMALEWYYLPADFCLFCLFVLLLTGVWPQLSCGGAWPWNNCGQRSLQHVCDNRSVCMGHP